MFGNRMKHCLVFASLISPSKMILFEKKYQTFDTVFHHQMKHCISCLIYYITTLVIPWYTELIRRFVFHKILNTFKKLFKAPSTWIQIFLKKHFRFARIGPTKPVKPLPETASFRSRSQSSLFKIRFVDDWNWIFFNSTTSKTRV